MSQTSKVALSGDGGDELLGVIRDTLGRTTILIFFSLNTFKVFYQNYL